MAWGPQPHQISSLALVRGGSPGGGDGAAVGAVQWLKVNPGAGSLPCTSQSFTATQYPELAKKLPLMPGLFSTTTTTHTGVRGLFSIAQAKSGQYAGRIIIGASNGYSYSDNPAGTGPFTDISSSMPWGTSYDIQENGMCWGPAGFFVAVGQILYRSADGISGWSAPLNQNRQIYGVFYNESLAAYIAFGTYGRVWYSVDGASFTAVTSEISGNSNPYTSFVIIPGTGRMHIGGGGYAITSDNGTDWGTPQSLGVELARIAYVNNFVYGIDVSTGNLLARSAGQGGSWSTNKSAALLWGDGVVRTGVINLYTLGGYALANQTNSGTTFITSDITNWRRMSAPTVGFKHVVAATEYALFAGNSGSVIRLPLRATPSLAPAYADDGMTLLTPYVKAA